MIQREVGLREDFPCDEELRLARQTTRNTNNKIKAETHTIIPKNGVNSRVPGRPETEMEKNETLI